MRRVVVTGMGALSPIGMDADSMWQSMIAGKHGFRKIEGFESEDMGITYAAVSYTHLDVYKRQGRARVRDRRIRRG